MYKNLIYLLCFALLASCGTSKKKAGTEADNTSWELTFSL